MNLIHSYKKQSPIVIIAFLFTLMVLVLGYISFGFWTMIILTSGFLGGFVLWMRMPSKGSWVSIRAAYWLTLAAFILHRIEEKQFGFFKELSHITGVSTPDILSLPVILLVIVSVGAWLLIPFLVKKQYAFGYYLAWTFFASMGITELAHVLIFPFFSVQEHDYFPGAASVIVLAPLAWWGMLRLAKGVENK